MKVTREEWLAAQERIKAAAPSSAHPKYVASLTEAVLGPCPPEPEPDDAVLRTYSVDGEGRDLTVGIRRNRGLRYVTLGLGYPSLHMDAATAHHLADALSCCAEWLDEQKAHDPRGVAA